MNLAKIYPKKKQGRPYDVFGRTHVKKAAANISVRDKQSWDKYYNADLGRFVNKSGSVTIGKREVRASDLYRSAYESGSLKVPDGSIFKMATGRLVQQKRSRVGRNESLANGILFENSTREVFRNLEVDPASVPLLKSGSYTITVEFYGRPDGSKEGHQGKGVKSHYRGDGSKHQHLEVFGNKAVMGGEKVVLSLLYKPCTFNVSADKIFRTKFVRLPKKERLYLNRVNTKVSVAGTFYNGSNDFFELYNLIPADCPNKPRTTSTFDVIKITQFQPVGEASGMPMNQIPLGLTKAQILSHEYMFLSIRKSASTIAQFNSPAPFCPDRLHACKSFYFFRR